MSGRAGHGSTTIKELQRRRAARRRAREEGRRRRRRGAGARRQRADGEGPAGRARAGAGGGQPRRSGCACMQGRPARRDLHERPAARGAGGAVRGDGRRWPSSPSPTSTRCRRIRALLAKSYPELDLYDPAVAEVDAAWALEQAIARRGRGAQGRRARHQLRGRDLVARARRDRVRDDRRVRRRLSRQLRVVRRRAAVRRRHRSDEPKKRNGYWWTASRFLAAARGRRGGRPRGRAPHRRDAGLAQGRDPGVRDRVRPRGRALDRRHHLLRSRTAASFWRKSSYLVGKEGEQVASPLVTIVDDPLIPRAPGSRPFDGDGLADPQEHAWSTQGVLAPVLCDVYSARKLGRAVDRLGGARHRRQPGTDHVEPDHAGRRDVSRDAAAPQTPPRACTSRA